MFSYQAGICKLGCSERLGRDRERCYTYAKQVTTESKEEHRGILACRFLFSAAKHYVLPNPQSRVANHSARRESRSAAAAHAGRFPDPETAATLARPRKTLH